MKKEYGKQLIDLAKTLGAEDAILFKIEDIAFDGRTILKCLYGCPGGLPYCPTSATEASNAMLFQHLIERYQWGVLVRTESLERGQKITIALERKAFLDGYYFALGATECANCQACSFEAGDLCTDKRMIRPPLYSLGIDVYKTVRGLGWTLDVVQKKGDPAKNITAVFVE